MPSNIPITQNGEHAQWLMRARQQTYADATALVLMQFIFIVVTPVIFAVLAIFHTELRPHFATASLVLVLIDIAFFDRRQRHLLRKAARICEQFDQEVLELPWNKFIAGARLDPEDIEAAAQRYPKAARSLAAIQDWYPAAVGRAPLHVARVACQLTNLRYDATLRNKYAAIVIALPVVIGIAIIALWLALKLSPQATVLTLLVPATPIVTWSLREFYRHGDTARSQETLKGEAEALWARIRDCDEQECVERSREFQDAIFLRRVSSPIIFPFVYGLLRSKLEDEMNRGADERLAEIGYRP
jgi:hypothetical protein